MRLYIWGSLCSITNYCMNSYLVLQVTTAYASKLVSRFAFQEADWLGLVWNRLTLASDWLRDARALLSCIGQVIAQNSSVCLNVFSCAGRGGPTCKDYFQRQVWHYYLWGRIQTLSQK